MTMTDPRAATLTDLAAEAAEAQGHLVNFARATLERVDKLAVQLEIEHTALAMLLTELADTAADAYKYRGDGEAAWAALDHIRDTVLASLERLDARRAAA